MKQVLGIIGAILSIGIFSMMGYAEDTIVVGAPASGTNKQATINIKTIVSDSVRTKFYNMSGNYTITDTDYAIFCNATGGDITATLPPAADICTDNNCGMYVFKKTDGGSNDCILDGDSSETIDSTTTFTLSTEGEAITVHSNTTEWFIE